MDSNPNGDAASREDREPDEKLSESSNNILPTRSDDNKRIGRRRYLQIAGLATVGIGALTGPIGAESALPHSIVIEGGNWGSTSYRFTVSGSLQADADGSPLEGHDKIDGNSASGKVSPNNADAYRFDGEITSLDVSNEANVDITYNDTNSSATVDSLSASEIETEDGDAAFDVAWAVSDPDGNLDTLELTLSDDSDGGAQEETTSTSVSGDSASGTTRLVAAGDDGTGHSYTVEAIVSDAEGASDSATTTVSEYENTSATVDNLSGTEIETSDSDAEFDVDWSVSDPDGNLDIVDLALSDDSDSGAQEDSASTSVSGDTASGTTRLVANGDEGTSHSYTVELVVSDAEGPSDSATTTVSEYENDPATVDNLSATEVETEDGDAAFDVSWDVTDSDGNLDTLSLTLTDDGDGGTQEDSASTSVSGESASGTTRLFASGDDGTGHSYTVEAVVSDTEGASDSATTSVSETEESSGSGFTWDQTHVDTSWLEDAVANDNLTIETVTNLDAYGDGSLAAALDAAENNDNTLVVFEVGGIIDRNNETYLRSFADNVYIAGQTAPSPGVTIYRGGMRIHGNNHIMEHVTVLPGYEIDDPHKARPMTVNEGTSNNLFNHCTFGWGSDEGFLIWEESQNTAVINCINAESLNDSRHPEAPHGYGFICRGNASNVTYMGNLHAHHWRRNPRPNGAEIVMANNYIYNPGRKMVHGAHLDRGPCEMDWIHTVVEAGPDTNLGSDGFFNDEALNVFWKDMDVSDSMPMGDGDVDYVSGPQNLPSTLGLDSFVAPSDLEDWIVPRVGPRPADRPPHEQRIVNDLVNREGGLIDHEDEVGGLTGYTSTQRALDPPETGILDWLQGFSDDVE